MFDNEIKLLEPKDQTRNYEAYDRVDALKDAGHNLKKDPHKRIPLTVTTLLVHRTYCNNVTIMPDEQQQ